MATVTKCDRCGKYVDRLPESCPFISYEKNVDCTSKRYTMSLCPGCYESLLNWVNKCNKVDNSNRVYGIADHETDDE